jgi:hypothetical protein
VSNLCHTCVILCHAVSKTFFAIFLCQVVSTCVMQKGPQNVTCVMLCLFCVKLDKGNPTPLSNLLQKTQFFDTRMTQKMRTLNKILCSYFDTTLTQFNQTLKYFANYYIVIYIIYQIHTQLISLKSN